MEVKPLSSKYLMGIDAGTSRIKAVLFSLEGEEISEVSMDNEVIQGFENHVEQDMSVLWEKLVEVIKNLIDTSNIQSGDILGVGIAGQGEGCWLLDENGDPVGNAILWSDGRASKWVNEFKSSKEYLKIKEITGSYPFPGATSIILKWIKDHEPQKLKKSKYCLFSKDWLRYKLTGKVYLELTDASTSLLDLKNKEISKEVFDILDIKEATNLFPDLLKSTDFAGSISKEASEKTGLPIGIPVSAGLLDVVSTAIGTGTVKEGDCCTILGTTCCNEVVRGNYTCQGEDTSGFEVHGVEGRYLNVIAAMAGTPNLNWFINEFCYKDRELAQRENSSLYKILEEKIEKIPPGCEGVLYHPYINPAGERAPFYDPNARAQFTGVSLNTTRYHMLRALYEGVAFSIRDCLEGTHTSGKIYLAGGGSKSKLWAQMIADCTGREVVTLKGTEFTAKGVAITAGVIAGLYADIEEGVKKTVSFKKKYSPNTEKFQKYTAFYTLYKNMRESMTDLWKLRNDIIEGNFKA